jgi:hypothetical protein
VASERAHQRRIAKPFSEAPSETRRQELLELLAAVQQTLRRNGSSSQLSSKAL